MLANWVGKCLTMTPRIPSDKNVKNVKNDRLRIQSTKNATQSKYKKHVEVICAAIAPPA